MDAGLPATAQALFQTTNVWTLHLRFSAEQWNAMEPGEAEGMPGEARLPFGARGRMGGPGGEQAGPATFIAPTFLKAAHDQDKKLSREKFRALGEGWFSDWDKSKSGQIDFEQLREGIASTWELPQLGGPGAFGPNGRPPGPSLQGINGHRNGLAAAAGIDFKYVHADLEFAGQLLKDVAVRYKGNGTYMESRNLDKKSLKIDLNKYVKGQKVAGQSKLNLHNNVTDASWMNEVLSYRLFRDAGVPAPRTSYAKVYVTVPGRYDHKYFGLYSIVEEIDPHFFHDRFGSKQGTIFKPVTRDLFGYMGKDWAQYAQSYDPKTDTSDDDSQRVIDFSSLMTSASDEKLSTKIAEYLDLDEFARFMSVTVWLSTMDSILMMGQNFYVYLLPKTRQFQFLPWDLDHSFGQFPMGGTQDQREQLSLLKPWRGENRFLERVFNNETFKKLYLATMKEFSKTIFAPERFSRQVDEIAAAIRPSVAEESEAKLGRFDKVVAGEPVEHLGFGRGPGPRSAGAPESGDRPRFGPGGFMQPTKPIKGFVVARARSVEDQLAGKSEGATVSERRFGGGARGGFRAGPGDRGGFGPAMFLAHNVMDAFDTDKNGKLTHEEFTAGFSKWFENWNTDKSGTLSDEQLRAGINRDLSPMPGGPPGRGFGFGPRGGGPPPPDE
jgi:spore coat protein CotH